GLRSWSVLPRCSCSAMHCRVEIELRPGAAGLEFRRPPLRGHSMSMFRRLSLACLLLALAGCQSARVEDSQSQLFQRYLAEGRLAQADQLLDAAAARGADTERLAPYQRRLADAYLRQGQAAVPPAVRAGGTMGRGRPRGLRPAAPAPAAGPGSAAVQPQLRSALLRPLARGDPAAVAAQPRRHDAAHVRLQGIA